MKKFLSLILALMMLSLPALAAAEDTLGLIGGADGPTSVFVGGDIPQTLEEKALAAGRKVSTSVKITEVSGIDTGDARTDAALVDLFNALGFTVSQQGDEFNMALQISGQDALDLGFSMSGEDVYLKSSLIGGTVVVGTQELEGLIDRLVDMLIMVEGMSEEEAADLRAQISGLKQLYADSLELSMASMLTEEDLKNLNMTSIEAFIAFAEGKTVPVEEIVVPRMCDPAVSGEKAVLTNADMVQVVKYFYQFILDNPKLMNYLGSQLGFPTEEEITLQWQSMGQFYMAFKIYESEEAFRAQFQTFEQLLNEMIVEVDASKFLDGEFTVTEYTDADGNVVYATMSLPLFLQDQTLMENTSAETAQGETTQINATYTRQTVAGGVAHVCNIDVDGEVITIDVLESENGFTLRSTDTDTEGKTWRIEMNAECSASTEEPGVELLTVTGGIYNEKDQPVLDVLLMGASEFSDVRSYLSGELTLTVFEYPQAEEEAAEEEAAEEEAVEETAVGQTEATEHEAEAVDAEPTKTVIVLAFDSDTAINGVDFTGTTNMSLTVEDVRIAAQAVVATSDPGESIMAGAVVRPAELDDGDFANWFVGAYNSLNSLVVNLIQTLPESVLMLMFGGM